LYANRSSPGTSVYLSLALVALCRAAVPVRYRLAIRESFAVTGVYGPATHGMDRLTVRSRRK
jgi:hypothetical protein